MNMSVNIAGVELKNPVMTASGTFGSGMEYGEYVDLNKLGAVVTKGVATVPWPGNPTPRIAETYGLLVLFVWHVDDSHQLGKCSGFVQCRLPGWVRLCRRF